MKKIAFLLSIAILQGCATYKIKNSRNNYAYIYFDMTTYPKNLSLDHYFDDLLSKNKLEESYAHLMHRDTSTYIIRLVKGENINLTRIYKYASFYEDSTKASLKTLVVSFRKDNGQRDTIFIASNKNVIRSSFRKTLPLFNFFHYNIKD